MSGWSYDKVYEPPRDLQTLEEIIAKLRSENKELIEVVAKAIYDSETEDYEITMEEKRRFWKLIPEVPWDSDDREISEWERDDYRILAKAAIVAMNLYVVNKEKGNND